MKNNRKREPFTKPTERCIIPLISISNEKNTPLNMQLRKYENIENDSFFNIYKKLNFKFLQRITLSYNEKEIDNNIILSYFISYKNYFKDILLGKKKKNGYENQYPKKKKKKLDKYQYNINLNEIRNKKKMFTLI